MLEGATETHLDTNTGRMRVGPVHDHEPLLLKRLDDLLTPLDGAKIDCLDCASAGDGCFFGDHEISFFRSAEGNDANCAISPARDATVKPFGGGKHNSQSVFSTLTLAPQENIRQANNTGSCVMLFAAQPHQKANAAHITGGPHNITHATGQRSQGIRMPHQNRSEVTWCRQELPTPAEAAFARHDNGRSLCLLG